MATFLLSFIGSSNRSAVFAVVVAPSSLEAHLFAIGAVSQINLVLFTENELFYCFAGATCAQQSIGCFITCTRHEQIVEVLLGENAVISQQQ